MTAASSTHSRTRRTAALLATLCLLLAACTDNEADPGRDTPEPTPSGSAEPATPTARPVPAELEVAVSETREDSVYPHVGDPLVDALHYDLALAWTPDQDLLEATEVLTFRATRDARRFRLDLSDALEVGSLEVDGRPAEFTHRRKDLVVDHPVTAEQVYELELEYAGTPEPWPAPSSRPDFRQGLGWNITPEHETYSLQEPYGAFTWYAVNDQPADKALYDFTLTVPEPWTGVANGELTDATTEDGLHTTTWHLAEPASSYLVIVAFADYTVTRTESDSGVPVTIWAPTDEPGAAGETDYAPEAIDWAERHLGPYPFDTFGVLIYDGESGMETQTMVSLGDTEYSTSRPVVVHEVVHHWYGNTVSPADWSDVWMNEGMAMYLQGMWEAEQEGVDVERVMDRWAVAEREHREFAGPPADYDPRLFGDGNIYYGPALMWHELRERIGDERFFAMVRAWPEEQENDTADRREYLAWIEQHTGEELTRFFRAWLLGERTPPRD